MQPALPITVVTAVVGATAAIHDAYGLAAFALMFGLVVWLAVRS